MTTCYMCSALATSKEHAPPKCLFPEQKDLPTGVDYRKNLISVPSCVVHNSSNSKDDEYLLAVVAAHFENNVVATDHYANKIRRALRRSPAFPKTLLDQQKPVLVDGQPSVAFKVDRSRFDGSIVRATRALYFHDTQKKWLARAAQVHSPAFRESDLSKMPALNDFEALMRQFAKVKRKPWRGKNSEVFRYWLEEERGRLLAWLQFYKGMDVWVLSGRGVQTALGVI